DNPAIQAEQDAMKETIDRVRETLQNEPLMPGGVAVSSDAAADSTDSTDTTEQAPPVETKSQKAASDIHNPMFRIVLALTAASLLIALSISYSGNGIKFGQFGCNAHQHGADVARRNSPFTQGSNTIQEPVPTDKQTSTSLADQAVSDSKSDKEVSQLGKNEVAKVLPSSSVEKDSQKADVQAETFRREAAPTVTETTTAEKKASVAVNAKPTSVPMAPAKASMPAPSPAPAEQNATSAKRKSRGGTGVVASKEIYESNAPSLGSDMDAAYSVGVPQTRQNTLGGVTGSMSSAPQMMVTPRVIIQEEEEDVRNTRNSIIQPEPRRRPIMANGEGYSAIKENEFVPTKDETFSTFSIDVDTASYSNVRRFLDMGRLPPAHAVKIEELVNYFKYDYAPPKSDAKEPFATQVEVEPCPWESSHLLARIAIKGKEIPKAKRPPLNLVFLIDVSGSMSSPNKLPLVKRAFEELVNQLDERDQVAIVTYAGSSKVHLKTTKGNQSETILRSIDKLSASGSTAGADGIRTAYEIAKEQFDKGGVNRVILCTDGDFNVGMTDNKELENMIAQKA
ncbi:MAG: von Willebrand factor type A domain-containing protein, partial [Planctomycetia bacterium]|nr:von Willebrand factor type A domain-containing protein [Planctomycetia bacterium]